MGMVCIQTAVVQIQDAVCRFVNEQTNGLLCDVPGLRTELLPPSFSSNQVAVQTDESAIKYLQDVFQSL
jgi:hypothetical protein